jgi:hypothetical protein
VPILNASDPVTSGSRALCLSFAEETVWLLNRLQEGSDEDGLFGRMSSAFRLNGPLDVAAIQQAAVEIVGRHQVLRTSFRQTTGGLERHVHPIDDFHPIVEQVSTGGPTGDPHAEATALIAREANRRFDLDSGPLWRFRIIRVSDLEHYLQLTVHHIVSDAWSGAIILRDLGALYNQFSGGLGAVLPELHVQYAEYAARERESLTGPRSEAALAYWRRQLRDAPRHLDLPTDRPREPRVPHVSATFSFTLPSTTGRAVVAAAKDGRATPFVFLLTAFEVLLHKLSGQASMVVGTPMMNRNRVEWENVVGLFLDILALRTDLSGNDTFAQVLHRVRDTLFGAITHADIPTAALAQTLGLLPLNEGRPPFFPVVFNFRNSSLMRAGRRRALFSRAFQNDPRLLEALRRAGALKLRGVQIERVPTTARETSQFDLTLNVNPLMHGEIRFDLIYDRSLFSPDTMRGFGEQYMAVVQHALAHPQQGIHAYPPATHY